MGVVHGTIEQIKEYVDKLDVVRDICGLKAECVVVQEEQTDE
jgi:hypothetical protein